MNAGEHHPLGLGKRRSPARLRRCRTGEFSASRQPEHVWLASRSGRGSDPVLVLRHARSLPSLGVSSQTLRGTAFGHGRAFSQDSECDVPRRRSGRVRAVPTPIRDWLGRNQSRQQSLHDRVERFESIAHTSPQLKAGWPSLPGFRLLGCEATNRAASSANQSVRGGNRHVGICDQETGNSHRARGA